jgi:hypothetical protein
MSTTFTLTLNPTPFGFFDSDSDFQTEADAMITFVKRRLGDDVLSVELTKKQIWACFEESFLEYASIVNQYQARSQLLSLLGMQTGSLDEATQKFPRDTLNYVIRMAEPYAVEAGLGGSYNAVSGAIQLRQNVQDYDLYTDLIDPSTGAPIVSSSLNPERRKMRVFEIMHFNPSAAYRFFDTTSAINYLNNEFSFESFTPETVFYVLPVFEDILRGGQMNISNRVRRSNYSYRVTGTKLRIFPAPTADNPLKLWVRVGFESNPLLSSIPDDKSMNGVSNLSNVPYGNFAYSRVNSIARQWVRQYTLALCKELLGMIRSKFGSVPIPGGELQLDGSDLKSTAKEEKDKLKTDLREMLDTLTYNKLIETKAAEIDNLQKILKATPIPMGRVITIG